MKSIIKYIIYPAIFVFLFTSCLKELRKGEFGDDAISSTIKVRVVPPQGHTVSLNELKIKLSDISTGLDYSAVTDENGEAEVRVSYGTYTASTELKIKGSGIMEIYNGSSDKIRVTPDDPAVMRSVINLNYSRSGQIVIKEFYYGGCWDDDNNKAYLAKDYYFTIYNNSPDITYLDSVCVGIINPLNAPVAGKVSQWVKPGTGEIRDSIPCGAFVWMFRGNGKDIPLEPGKEIVCCVNAINHSAKVSSSVDLSKPGYYAMYATGITTAHSAPVAGVNTMEMIWRAGASKAFSISTASPGLLVFTLGNKSIDKYIKDNYTVNPASPTNRTTDCLFVDKNLVLDGVECFRAASNSKRFRPEIDNGFAMTPGSGKGYSIIRKIDHEATLPGGPVIYMDTNNSSNDFEVSPRATLTGKK